MTQTTIKDFLNELKQLSAAESVPCIGGRSELPTQPGLMVKGRPISLPATQKDLHWLCEQGEQSPFGKGMDTLVDTDVRRSIEFEGHDITLSNPHWSSSIDRLIKTIKADMGIDYPVSAELFKLLVYREGGHFKFHQDTEKSLGMFATLIIQLPSRCQGGSLTCRFNDKEYHFDFGNQAADAEFSVYYAAHYADVHHQVEDIVKGARVVLVYNLIQPVEERKLSANHHQQLLDSASDRIAPIFSLLSQEQHALLLQHEYTEQSLSTSGFLAMKGQDRDLITALQAINDHLPLEQKLDLMISRIGYSVISDGCGGGYYGNDDIHWEEMESGDPSCDLCFDQGGQKIPADGFHIDWIHDLNGKTVNTIAFDQVDEDFWGEGEDDIEGFMGNYGPTKETTYANYLLTIIPTYPDDPNAFSQGGAFHAHKVLSMVQNARNNPDCHWLRDRLDQALHSVLEQFDALVNQEESRYEWRRGFDQSTGTMFSSLFKAAIDMNNLGLCQTLVDKAKECLIASLASEYHEDSQLNLIKQAIDHFTWPCLSDTLTPLLATLSGSASLKTVTALAENSKDNAMCAQLAEICVKAICNEKKEWGANCCFKTTIVPLALLLCNTSWSVQETSKTLFLATCLEKGKQHPSFLSALIQQLINDTQADDKEWLLHPLMTARLEYLESQLKKEPGAFTWSMPNATVKNKHIAAFLQGEDQQVQMTGYDGIAMARKDVVSIDTPSILPEFHLESNADFTQPEINYGFSALMEAKGRGKQAYVEVTKDKRYYKRCLKLRQLHEDEYKRLQQMIEMEPV